MAEAETYAQKNQDYWNRAAESVHKETWIHDLQNQISLFLKSNLTWLAIDRLPKDAHGRTTAKMMDYACGNGIVSRTLHSHFSQLVGVDLSEGMLSKYRATANELGLSESEMMTVQGDLLAPKVVATNPPLTVGELNNFDLVAICMALHHVDDIHLATKRLAERLRPGGVLLVIDWAKLDTSTGTGQLTSRTTSTATNLEHVHHHANHVHEDRHHKPHPASHTISHDSFTKDLVLKLFEQAGCVGSEFLLADRLSIVPGARSGKMQLFMARATRL